MPVKPDALLAEVPHLRRHARLLTGSMELGDEYVRLCLELVVAEPERLEGGELRLELFRAFYDSWEVINRATSGQAPEEGSDVDRLEERLAKLAPIDRQVLLLTACEDFTPEQAGWILNLDAAGVDAHLKTAREALRHDAAVPVFIIEDETMIALELSEIIQEMGLTVAGLFARQEDAIAAASGQQPGLVLADIQLADEGNGIAAAQAILQRYHVPIVFVTGYPERLLTGDGLEPAFVVAKPFRVEGLKAMIAHALAVYAAPGQAADHRAKLLGKLRQITGHQLQQQSA